jgi:hypothetical protein
LPDNEPWSKIIAVVKCPVHAPCLAVVKFPADLWNWRVPTFIALLTAATLVHTLADELKPAEAAAKQEAKEHKLKAEADAKAWTADAFQLDDKAKREAAIESIRAAMAGRTRKPESMAATISRRRPTQPSAQVRRST